MNGKLWLLQYQWSINAGIESADVARVEENGYKFPQVHQYKPFYLGWTFSTVFLNDWYVGRDSLIKNTALKRTSTPGKP